MALPPLTFRERILYKDTFTAYVPVNAAVVNPSLSMLAGNDTASWTIAPVSDTDNTKIQNIKCNLHLTPNFDQPLGMAGLNKMVNIDTSNLLTCQREVKLQAVMRIFATTRYGDSFWAKVEGDPEHEVLVPCTCVYIVPDKQPSVIT